MYNLSLSLSDADSQELNSQSENSCLLLESHLKLKLCVLDLLSSYFKVPGFISDQADLIEICKVTNRLSYLGISDIDH